jgi:hypothetical protein
LTDAKFFQIHLLGDVLATCADSGDLLVLERALLQVRNCRDNIIAYCSFTATLQTQELLSGHLPADTPASVLQRASVSLVLSNCVDAATGTMCATAADRLRRYLQVPSTTAAHQCSFFLLQCVELFYVQEAASADVSALVSSTGAGEEPMKQFTD